MPDSPSLPGNHAWRDAQGRPLPVEFFKFFRDLLRFVQQASGNTVDIASILERLDALEAAGNATIQGLASVIVEGSLTDGVVQLLLDGDVALPDPGYYYGTDEAGVKGWFERLLASLNDVDLTGLANGDTLIWNSGTGKFEPGTPAPPQVFNYITSDGEPYCTEDYADLYTGVL
ncbi:hypothetical protein [Pseudoxanthomonas beigongshangi]